MSKWTHITACIYVDTGLEETKQEVKRRVRDYLEDAPNITGSEGFADIFINIPTGYNTIVSHDCSHCVYEDNSSVFKDDYLDCVPPPEYDCSAKFQSCAVISIQGNLRDKTKDKTKKEFEAFLKYVNAAFVVYNYSVNIEED